MQSGGDVSSQNFWKFVHVKIPQAGSHYQVDHCGHTEQLRLVDRDLRNAKIPIKCFFLQGPN